MRVKRIPEELGSLRSQKKQPYVSQSNTTSDDYTRLFKLQAMPRLSRALPVAELLAENALGQGLFRVFDTGRQYVV